MLRIFQSSTFSKILLAHVDMINFFAMQELMENGTFSEEDQFDSICLSRKVDLEKRPGVPFDLSTCCSVPQLNLFEEEQWKADHTMTFHYDCQRPSGNIIRQKKFSTSFGLFALDDNDVFFLSSCANSYISDNATHLWRDTLHRQKSMSLSLSAHRPLT